MELLLLSLLIFTVGVSAVYLIEKKKEDEFGGGE